MTEQRFQLKQLKRKKNKINELGHEKMCFMPYPINKGADQPAHLRILISAFVVRCQRQNDTASLYIRNFKILAGRCSWAGQFVAYLVKDSWRHFLMAWLKCKE